MVVNRVCLMLVLVFFFSSRRRHTRWPRDWSSDVCSSDLALRRVAGDLVERPADDLFRLPIDRVFAVAGAGTVVTGSTWSGSVRVGDTRSEERRVGKECK